MKRFAMLVEDPKIGQIVVMQRDGENGPEIAFFFDPGVDGLGVCSTNIGFTDDDAGYEKADRAFAQLNDDRVVAFAQAGIAKINQVFTGDES